MKQAAAAAVAVTLAFAAGAALAHSSFLLPSTTVMSKPQWITVDAAIGNDMFFFNHNPMRLDGLLVTAPDGSALAPQNAMTGKLRSVFDLELAQSGTYRIANAFSGVFARYKDKASGQPKGWRGNAEAFAKEVPADAEELRVSESSMRLETFVTVGKPSEIRRSGVGLEFVPVTHPNDLYTGEDATFGFVLDGQPASGLKVEIIPAGNRYRDQLGEIERVTDAQGRIRVQWPAPGFYRLEISTTDAKTSVQQAKERRLVYAAVLEVLPH